MVHEGHPNRSSHGSLHQEGRRDRDNGVKWEHVKDDATNAALFILFFLGLAIIFSPLWLPIIPYLRHDVDVVGIPVLLMLSLTMFLSILWNISFYINKRKELRVARKLIHWVATQRNVPPRIDKERGRLDRVLKAAIWALRNGEDVRDIMDGLNEGTRDGEALPEGWARFYYETAIDRLTDGAGRDHVLGWEERERDLQEGEKMLWATQAENLR